MRRKLIQHGPSSLTISLPAEWIKEFNLKKGEEIDMIEEDGDLRVSPIHKNNAVKKTEVSFDDLNEQIRSDILLALQKNGYDQVKINCSSSDVAKELNSFLNANPIGFEITKQESNHVIIENVSNPESDQLENMYRRVFRVTTEYMKKIQALLNKQEEITDTHLLHEASMFKFSNYCKRIIVKEKTSNACFLHEIITNLELIAKSCSELLEEIRQQRQTISEHFISLHKKLLDALSEVYELYYDFSIEKYSKVKAKSNAIKEDIEKVDFNNTIFSYSDYLKNMHQRIESILSSVLSIHL